MEDGQELSRVLRPVVRVTARYDRTRLLRSDGTAAVHGGGDRGRRARVLRVRAPRNGAAGAGGDVPLVVCVVGKRGARERVLRSAARDADAVIRPAPWPDRLRVRVGARASDSAVRRRRLARGGCAMATAPRSPAHRGRSGRGSRGTWA